MGVVAAWYLLLHRRPEEIEVAAREASAPEPPLDPRSLDEPELHAPEPHLLPGVGENGQ